MQIRVMRDTIIGMKTTLLAACLFLATTVVADDAVAPAKDAGKAAATQLDNGAELPIIAAPTFEGPLDASFSVAKGTWTPAAWATVRVCPAMVNVPVRVAPGLAS